MGKTTIEWTRGDDGSPGETWNPLAGCSPVSPGCTNCYAASMAKRLEAMGQEKYRGTAERRGKVDVFTGRINLDEKSLEIPLRWKKPRRIFVNSMSDLFHADVPFEFIDRVFAVMALTPWHTYQILTKRPERMAEYMKSIGPRRRGYIHEEHGFLADCLYSSSVPEAMINTSWKRMSRWHHGLERLRSIGDATTWPWPLPNVWLGTSVEDQQRADERIPKLLEVPAAVRFLSCEPMLGPVCLHEAFNDPGWDGHDYELDFPAIHWVIVGGESGSRARPMHPNWARSIRDQCQQAGVAFHFKQWGEWAPDDYERVNERGRDPWPRQWFGEMGTYWSSCMPGSVLMRRFGKKESGRLLDGREWNEFPVAPAVTEGHA